MIRFELHLEGCAGPVLWPPDNHVPGNTLPPRVVMHAGRVWTFYRYRSAQLSGYRAATYRRATVLHLTPGEYGD